MNHMKLIVVILAPILFFMVAFRPFHDLTVKGRISDENGAPVSGAIIQVKGSSTLTSSNQTGDYSIRISWAKSILIINAAGYDQHELKVNGRPVINVILKTSCLAIADSIRNTIVIARGTGSAGKRILSEEKKTMNGNSYSWNNKEDGLTGYYDRRKPIQFESYHEGYDHITENRFLKVTDNPLSTFSIDVDAASYSNIRRFLNGGQLPPEGAIRIEEMVNYFHYEYPQPKGDKSFSINTEMSDAPWNKEHKLVLIGLQGKKIPTENLPASNLTFLIDVSGSMMSEDKLPLVKASMKLLVDQLREEDRISIVVYAGAAGLILSPTSGADKMRIREAIDKLEAGGSTAGGAGIKLAYATARQYFVRGGNNRVILCTDGDFNVGESSDDAMERLIETERKSGVFLTVLGYGTGNYQDAKMQKLADKGNGNHAYIDGIAEAKKVLVNEFGGTLFTIAKDVKLQVEFNPALVQGYRLIGYENRMLAKEDFNNDKKDAGELGSGHTVTALYEIIPAGVSSTWLKNVDTLKYQTNLNPFSRSVHNNEMLTVKFRYKEPEGEASKLIEHPVIDRSIDISSTSDNFRFAAAVAEFGMVLCNSEFRSAASFDQAAAIAKKARGDDAEGYRSEFIRLIEIAKQLKNNNIGKTRQLIED